MTQALPKEKAAQLSEKLPAESAAQVHEQLPEESIHKVQSEMPPEKVVAIAEAAPAEPAQKGPNAKKPLVSDNAEQFQAIDELKPLAKTQQDHETIRSWEDEYGRMQPKDAFEAANKASDAVAKDADLAKKEGGRAVKSELLDAQLETAQKSSTNIPEMLEAQKQARVGANPELQGQRSAFEHALAREALANPEVQQATQNMSKKVLDYIERTRPTPEARAEALKKLGAGFEKGYAGAVGTDEVTMRAVLGEGGNVREQMLAIENFHRLVGADLLDKGGIGIKGLQEIFGTVPEGSGPAVKDPTKFGAAEVADLQTRLKTYQQEFQEGVQAGTIKPDAKMDAKGLFSPLEAERGANGPHADYADAKAQNMDTKLPGFASEQLSQFADLKPGTGPLVGAGEANPLARAKLTAADFTKMGIELSPREQAKLAQQGYLEWVQGNVANMVNPNAEFIQDARSASMPLQAGISGTTYRFMGMADLLGADPQLARLAAVGNLASIDAHSFHEIASAAQGFAGGYDVSMPYTPASTGLDAATLKRLAAQNHLSLDTLNNGQSLPEPSKEQSAQ